MAVRRWLEETGLGQYAERCEACGFDLDDASYFRELSEEDAGIVAREELLMADADVEAFLRDYRACGTRPAAAEAGAAEDAAAPLPFPGFSALSTAQRYEACGHFWRLPLRPARKIFNDLLCLGDLQRFRRSFPKAADLLQFYMLSPERILALDLADASERRPIDVDALNGYLVRAHGMPAFMDEHTAIVQQGRVALEEHVQIEETLESVRRAVAAQALDEFSNDVLENALSLGLESHPDVQRLRKLEYRPSLPRSTEAPRTFSRCTT